MAKDLEAPKPFVPSVFSDGARLDAGNVEEMRFGLAGSGPLAKAVLDSNAASTLRQLIGNGFIPTIVTSTTRPVLPVIGQLIYQTDTNEYLKYVSYGGSNRWMQSDLKPNRNLVINGAFNVAQRSTGTVALTTGSVYGSADRWLASQATTAAGSIQQITTSLPTQVTNGVVFSTGSRFGRNAAANTTGNIQMSTAFETVDSIKLKDKLVTLSFWAKAGSSFSSSSNALTAQVWTGTGTDQAANNFGAWSGGATPINQTATLTTSWIMYSFVGTISNTTTQIGVNFSYTPVGIAGADDNVYITGVQLESGSAPSEFEFESYDTALLKCQRYYAASLSGSDYFANNYFWGAGPSGLYNFGIGVAFPRAMRIVPTLSVNFINFDNCLNGGQTVHASGFTQYYRNANGSFPYCGWRGTYTATAEL